MVEPLLQRFYPGRSAGVGPAGPRTIEAMATTDRDGGAPRRRRRCSRWRPSPAASASPRPPCAPGTAATTWARRRTPPGPTAATAPDDLARLVVMRRLTLEGVPPAEAARIALARSDAAPASRPSAHRRPSSPSVAAIDADLGAAREPAADGPRAARRRPGDAPGRRPQAAPACDPAAAGEPLAESLRPVADPGRPAAATRRARRAGSDSTRSATPRRRWRGSPDERGPRGRRPGPRLAARGPQPAAAASSRCPTAARPRAGWPGPPCPSTAPRCTGSSRRRPRVRCPRGLGRRGRCRCCSRSASGGGSPATASTSSTRSPRPSGRPARRHRPTLRRPRNSRPGRARLRRGRLPHAAAARPGRGARRAAGRRPGARRRHAAVRPGGRRPAQRSGRRVRLRPDAGRWTSRSSSCCPRAAPGPAARARRPGLGATRRCRPGAVGGHPRRGRRRGWSRPSAL